MSKFSKAEQLYAKYLSRFPVIKSWIKVFYQSFVYVFYRKPAKFYLHDKADLIPASISTQHITFGGYYDKTLIIDNKIVTHQINVKEADLLSNQINILAGDNKISVSNAWNWQQGAMLSWFTDNEIIFNDFRDSNYVAVIKNIKTGEEKLLSKPVYTVSRDRSLALTLNFKRLAKYRPDYGYFNLPYSELEDESHDGVYKIDLVTGKTDLIISLDRLINFEPRIEMRGAAHKVNHLMISPDSKRFMFLHRWYTPKGVKYSRLYTSDSQGENLCLLADDQMVSHCTWKNSKEIVGWLRKKEGDHYYCLTDQSTTSYIMAEGLLNEDGHPSISRDEKWLLTDTYPDKSRMSQLYLYDIVRKRNIVLGSFFSPLKYRGVNRCDLHPRFSADERSISFDSTHEISRNMYIMDISKVIQEYEK